MSRTLGWRACFLCLHGRSQCQDIVMHTADGIPNENMQKLHSPVSTHNLLQSKPINHTTQTQQNVLFKVLFPQFTKCTKLKKISSVSSPNSRHNWKLCLWSLIPACQYLFTSTQVDFLFYHWLSSRTCVDIGLGHLRPETLIPKLDKSNLEKK